MTGWLEVSSLVWPYTHHRQPNTVTPTYLNSGSRQSGRQ
jgi:hypothetical protein